MSKRISVICTYPFFMHISNILQKQSEGIKKYNSARCLIDCRMDFIISQVSLDGFQFCHSDINLHLPVFAVFVHTVFLS